MKGQPFQYFLKALFENRSILFIECSLSSWFLGKQVVSSAAKFLSVLSSLVDQNMCAC